MKYEKLEADQQAQMLEQRLGQYEMEHYQHSVNLSLLVASGATDDATKEAIKASQDAMDALDDAHANTLKEAAKVKPKVTKEK